MALWWYCLGMFAYHSDIMMFIISLIFSVMFSFCRRMNFSFWEPWYQLYFISAELGYLRGTLGIHILRNSHKLYEDSLNNALYLRKNIPTLIDAVFCLTIIFILFFFCCNCTLEWKLYELFYNNSQNVFSQKFLFLST